MNKNTLKTLLFLSLVFILSSYQQERTINIFMIGDSTMANKDISGDKQERGWGMVLQNYFTDNVIVDNHAVNGRSTKSFINEGRWQKVVDKICPGDYVIIQFGHNDEKPNADRHTDPGSTFDANLERFVNETRAKGGKPIICNCVVRRNFYRQSDNSVDDESLRNKTYEDENINSDTLIDTHGDYRIAPRIVAERLHVPFVDANQITERLENSLGVIGSRKLHMWFKPGEHPSLPKGKLDNTHYNVYGAHVVAGLLVDEITKQVPELTQYVNHFDISVAKDGSGHFFDLQDAVNLAAKNMIPSPDGKGFMKVKGPVTIRVGKGNWNKPVLPKNNQIRICLTSGAKWLEK